jgi:hypothetical protein
MVGVVSDRVLVPTVRGRAFIVVVRQIQCFILIQISRIASFLIVQVLKNMLGFSYFFTTLLKSTQKIPGATGEMSACL